MSPPAKIFICYSRADEKFRKRLEMHLAPLKREGIVAPWHYGMIVPGSDEEAELKRHVVEADIVLLLVSPNLLASDHNLDNEIAVALERHHAGVARLVPILVRPSDHRTMPFARLSPLPSDGKAISAWSSADAAWLDVVRGIRRVIEAFNTNKFAQQDARSWSWQKKRAMSSSAAVKILFLGANGTDSSRLRLSAELRDIQAEIQRAQSSREIEVRAELAVTPIDLNRLLLEYEPDIVHFSGHGTAVRFEVASHATNTREFNPPQESSDSEARKESAILLETHEGQAMPVSSAILLETHEGQAMPVSVAALARLFGILQRQRCVVLNACFSAAQAAELAAHVDCVIGMKRAINDQSAIVFAIGFYQAIARGQTVKTAFDLGCSLITTSGLEDADVPELRGRVDPATVRLGLARKTEKIVR